jgi:protoporphyrin/coproporphyrin ferrochelatase
MTKRGVLLLQFGGPDSPAAIRPFLRDLFDDREILPMPTVVRKPLAWTIAKLRAPQVAAHYAHMEGGASPIGRWTRVQADALAARLGGDVPVEVAMRAWKPSTADALDALRARGVTELVVIPLYPQYSFTTTRSSMTVLLRELPKRLAPARVFAHERWPTEPKYVAATVETIRKGREAAGLRDPHVLFSAHGLPVRVVAKGDPYPREIDASVAAVVAAAGLTKWSLAFQSRVGPVKWLEPSTDAEIARLAAAGVAELLLVPISFVSDHYETLYEMGRLYADLARAKGIRGFGVAPGLNDEPLFIDALEALARRGFEQLDRPVT